jgi:hypothetical protein
MTSFCSSFGFIRESVCLSELSSMIFDLVRTIVVPSTEPTLIGGMFVESLIGVTGLF